MNALVTHHVGGITFNFGALAATYLTQWPSGPGIYMMCRHDPASGKYYVLYIGQASDFSSRLGSHERWSEAVSRGMTHVLVTTVPGQAQRDSWEELLIKTLNPEMNVLLRPVSGALADLFKPRR